MTGVRTAWNLLAYRHRRAQLTRCAADFNAEP
jgi:hypothetical protein